MNSAKEISVRGSKDLKSVNSIFNLELSISLKVEKS